MLTISIVTQMVAKGMLFTRFGLPPNIIDNPNANGTKKSIEISNDNMWTFSLCFVSLFIFSSYVKNMFRIYQSKTFVVDDTVKFDNGTISSHNDIWDYDSSTTVLTRYDEYSSITEKVAGTDARLYCNNLPTSAVVEIELCQVDGEISQGGLNFYNGTTYIQFFALRELGYSSSIIGQWVKLQITYGNGSLTVVSLDDPTKTVTKTYNNNITSLSPSTNASLTEHRFRNFRVYNP